MTRQRTYVLATGMALLTLAGNLTAQSTVVTAGSGGVTLNYLVAEDTSNPTQFILPSSGGCGTGFALATATVMGTTFPMSSGAATIQTGVADNAITAGHILVGGTTTPGAVKDAGTAARNAVPRNTCIVGVALASATVGNTLSLLYDGPTSNAAGPLTPTTVPLNDVVCALHTDMAINSSNITSSGTITATSMTLNVGTTAGFWVGGPIGVTGVTNPASGYNGTYTVTVINSATQITFNNTSNPGAWVAGGSIYLPCANGTDAITATPQALATVVPIPSGFLQVPGRKLRVTAQGAIWSDSTRTVSVVELLAGTSSPVIANISSAIHPASVATAVPFTIVWLITSIDSSGQSVFTSTQTLSIPSSTSAEIANVIVSPQSPSTGAFNLTVKLGFSSNITGNAIALVPGALTVEVIN